MMGRRPAFHNAARAVLTAEQMAEVWDRTRQMYPHAFEPTERERFDSAVRRYAEQKAHAAEAQQVAHQLDVAHRILERDAELYKALADR